MQSDVVRSLRHDVYNLRSTCSNVCPLVHFLPAPLTMALRPISGSWPPLTGLRDHSQCTHYNRKDASGRLIGSTQRTLPDNTQQSREKDLRASGEIRTRNSSKQAAADCVASGVGSFSSLDVASGFIRSAKYL